MPDILGPGLVTAHDIVKAAEAFGTPTYLYDKSVIAEKGKRVLGMFNGSFGSTVRYAMKANSTRGVLETTHGLGLHIDASSLNEVIRANMAGIPYKNVLLTTQEVPEDKERQKLESMISQGLNYNVCSERQLELIADFAAAGQAPLSIRVHPGKGSGESSTRNTGDKYSCFGVFLDDLPGVLEIAKAKGLKFVRVHTHIGSGGDPKVWAENVDRQLGFVEEYFPDAEIVNFGGGLREARMPDETPADVEELGKYAVEQVRKFYERTGRKLSIEAEPGTYVVANAGFLITKVLDKKRTGDDGFRFIVANGGMEVNTRPLLYGSRHPFYIVSKDGKLLSSEFKLEGFDDKKDVWVVVGRCCESGDAQTLDGHGHIVERVMAEPDFGDYVVIGGAGAYGSAMSPFNYNSHLQAAEVMRLEDGTKTLIRKRQTIEQVVQNELPLEEGHSID